MARTHVDPLWSEIHEALNQVRFSIWASENGVDREPPRSDLAQRILGEIQLFIQQESNCQALVQGDSNVELERVNRNLQNETGCDEINTGHPQVEGDTVRNLGVYLSPDVVRGDSDGESDSSVPELEERPYSSRMGRNSTLTQRLRRNRDRCPSSLRGRGSYRARRAQRRFR